jgi:biopolymer transport protein TolQ
LSRQPGHKAFIPLCSFEDRRMDGAPTPDQFDLVYLFLRADPVVKAVMLGLALMSLWSWAVILDRTFRIGKLNKAADRFEREVGSGRSLEDLAAKAGDNPDHPLPLMLVVALREWRDARGRGVDAGLLLNRIDRQMDVIIAREGHAAEKGLGLLSIVATASPFIGLFGTVWGIMHAFQAIAVARNTNLTTVAPAISEALLATAIGLAAAIPAYMAYNKFTLDAARFTGRLETFADELAAAVAKRLPGAADKAA